MYLPHPETSASLCCLCLALGHWLFKAWSRSTQLTNVEIVSPFSTYKGGSCGSDEDPIVGHGGHHVLHSHFLNL